jgi:hypothetical protein
MARELGGQILFSGQRERKLLRLLATRPMSKDV